MTDYNLIQEMKMHSVIVSIAAQHSDLEISLFLKVARSFVHKVRKELEEENDVATTSKRKKTF